MSHGILHVPVVMSDAAEHRRRLANATNAVAAGHALPTRYVTAVGPILPIVTASGAAAGPVQPNNHLWAGFSGAVDQTSVIQVTLPKGYEEDGEVGVVLRWHKHNATSLTGTAVFWSRWRMFPVGVVATAKSATLTGSAVVAATTTQHKMFEVNLGNIASLTGAAAGTVLELEYGRLVAAGADDYDKTAMVATVEFSVPTNARGYDEPHTKYTE